MEVLFSFLALSESKNIDVCSSKGPVSDESGYTCRKSFYFDWIRRNEKFTTRSLGKAKTAFQHNHVHENGESIIWGKVTLRFACLFDIKMDCRTRYQKLSKRKLVSKRQGHFSFQRHSKLDFFYAMRVLTSFLAISDAQNIGACLKNGPVSEKSGFTYRTSCNFDWIGRNEKIYYEEFEKSENGFLAQLSARKWEIDYLGKEDSYIGMLRFDRKYCKRAILKGKKIFSGIFELSIWQQLALEE